MKYNKYVLMEKYGKLSLKNILSYLKHWNDRKIHLHSRKYKSKSEHLSSDFFFVFFSLQNASFALTPSLALTH